MLEYFKTILLKVSFDKKLFEKELRKAMRLLVDDEICELKEWCYQKFEVQYQPILVACFS